MSVTDDAESVGTGVRHWDDGDITITFFKPELEALKRRWQREALEEVASKIDHDVSYYGTAIAQALRNLAKELT